MDPNRNPSNFDDEDMDEDPNDGGQDFVDIDDPAMEVIAELETNAADRVDDDDDDEGAADAGAGHIEYAFDDGEDGDDMEEGSAAGDAEENYVDDAIGVFSEHTDAVHSLCQHPELPLVVSGGEDDLAFLWQYPECTTKHVLRGHSDTVAACAFSFDGQVVVTGSLDGVIKLWDVESGTMQVELEGFSDGVEWIICHPKGAVVFAGSSDGQACMWNFKGECMQLFAGHSDKVSCGALTLDGRQLVTGSADHTVRLFNPKTAETVHAFDKHKLLPECEVISLHISPHNGEVLLAGMEDGAVVWLHLGTGKGLKAERHHEGSVECIASCPNLPLFASCATDGTLCVWDATIQSLRNKTQLHGPGIHVVWREHNVLCCTAEGAVQLQDGRSGSADSVRVWRGHRGPVHAMLLGARSPHVLTASDDGECRVFPL